MLVCFINHSTAPVNLGGAERSMIALVEDWFGADPDFEAFFITKAPTGKFVEALEARGWPYRALPYLGWAVSHLPSTEAAAATQARDDYAATTRIIEEFESRRPDLVVTNTLVAPWGAFAAKALGIPHAWFVREYGDLDHGLQFLLGREQTLADIGLLSEAVFVNSRAMKTHVASNIDPARVSVVYPTVDLGRIEALAAEPPTVEPFPGSSDSTLKIAMIGRISEAKGQLEAIEAIGMLRDRGVTAQLCLVGAFEPATFDAEVHALAARLGVLDRIVFPGEQGNPFALVNEADVCVTGSRMEAFGRTTLEYLALGKPVIATSSGGSAELVEDGTNGFLYPSGDPSALAAALIKYAADRSLIADHGRAAAARAGNIGSNELDNRGAIEIMRALPSQPAYRLPNASRLWFALAANAGPIATPTRVGLARKSLRYLRARLGRVRRALRAR